MSDLQNIIETNFDQRAELDLNNPAAELLAAIDQSIEMLDSGEARVAEPTAAGWQVNEWLKKAVLTSFQSYLE